MIAEAHRNAARVPPSDADVERALLGVLIACPDQIDVAQEHIRADAFYGEANRALYAALCRMRDSGRKIDSHLIRNELARESALALVGGVAYLAEVIQSAGMRNLIPHYCHVIAQNAIRRSLIELGEQISQDGWDAACDASDAVAKAEGALNLIGTTGEKGETPVPVAQAAADAIVRVEEIHQRNESVGVLTGIEDFDRDIGGLFPGELVVLAARPGVGKTSLAMQIADHAAQHGMVYFASLEMGAVELAMRQMCAMSAVSSRRVRTGHVTESDLRALRAAALEFGQRQLVLHDRPGIRVSDVRRACLRLKRSGLRLVVVDYLQIITPQDQRVQRHEQVGQMTKSLKALARELEVPVMVLSQLNREPAGAVSQPGLHHLRESGSIEQDADVVMFLCREILKRGSGKAVEKYYHETRTKLDLAKNRNGITCGWTMEWNAQRTRYEQIAASGMENYDPSFDDFAADEPQPNGEF